MVTSPLPWAPEFAPSASICQSIHHHNNQVREQGCLAYEKPEADSSDCFHLVFIILRKKKNSPETQSGRVTYA